MRILILSDTPDKKYWDYYQDGMLNEFDLILSCGDLPPAYLSFIVTFAKAPVLYVRGNHDDCYNQTPPEGCICIENQIFNYKGLRILGLGGSMRYKQGENQYTDKEMERRIRKLYFPLKRCGGFDILLTHAPAKGLSDGEDLPHQGFKAFVDLIDKYSPGYFIHGHIHLNYGRQYKRTYKYKETVVINGFKSYILEIDD
ncbi:MAG: metallophosphoesterase [Lachnospiraceae bacterium]